MISETTIAAVKERTDLVALVHETVKLTRRGRSYVGLCPFHQEKTSSFHVNADRGFFHCFGCKESGSAIDFIMRAEGYDFPDAVRVLAERLGIEVDEASTDQEKREAAAARKGREDLYLVTNVAATFFERSLRGSVAHPLAHHALAELAKRGLPFPGEEAVGEAKQIGDTLQAFRVGYAPYGWDGLAGYLKQQGISPVLAEKVGLLVPRGSGSGYYDRFRHRLMFAVSDAMGRVVAFSGRALPEPAPAEISRLGIVGPAAGTEAPAKYINSPESPIYSKSEHLFGLHQGRQAIRHADEAVLVEGNFDVVALQARGVGNVVAPLGTAFTPEQAKLLRRFAGRVVLLFDPDTAGQKATRAARVPCRAVGLRARVAKLPTGLDPDAFIRARGHAAVVARVHEAQGMIEHLIDDAFDSVAFEAASLEDQAARVQAVIDLVREESDPTLSGMARAYADRISTRLILAGSTVANFAQLEASVRRAFYVPVGDEPAPVPLPGPTRCILGALLDYPSLLDDAQVIASLGNVEGDLALAVAGIGRDREKLAAESLPTVLQAFARARLAAPEWTRLADARRVLLDNARRGGRSGSIFAGADSPARARLLKSLAPASEARDDE